MDVTDRDGRKASTSTKPTDLAISQAVTHLKETLER